MGCNRECVLVASLCLVVAGCASRDVRVPLTEKLAELEEGASLNRVREVLRNEGTHQFLVQHEGKEYLCLRFRVASLSSPYYFVFSDGYLHKIVEPAGFEFSGLQYGGSTVSVRTPFDPFDKVKAVLSQRGLSGKDLAEAAQRRGADKLSFRQTPAAVLSAPVLALEVPRIAADYERNRELAQRYDASKLELGMTGDEVNAAFGGEPWTVYTVSADREMRIYGEDVSLDVNPTFRFSWVAVVLETGKVTAVFSHDFFHPQFREAPPPTGSGPPEQGEP